MNKTNYNPTILHVDDFAFRIAPYLDPCSMSRLSGVSRKMKKIYDLEGLIIKGLPSEKEYSDFTRVLFRNILKQKINNTKIDCQPSNKYLELIEKRYEISYHFGRLIDSANFIDSPGDFFIKLIPGCSNQGLLFEDIGHVYRDLNQHTHTPNRFLTLMQIVYGNTESITSLWEQMSQGTVTDTPLCMQGIRLAILAGNSHAIGLVTDQTLKNKISDSLWGETISNAFLGAVCSQDSRVFDLIKTTACEANISLNTIDSIMELALNSGQINRFKELLSTKINKRGASAQDYINSALLHAVEHEDLDCLNTLLTKNLTCRPDQQGLKTALITAASCKKFSCWEALLGTEVSCDSEDDAFWSPDAYEKALYQELAGNLPDSFGLNDFYYE